MSVFGRCTGSGATPINLLQTVEHFKLGDKKVQVVSAQEDGGLYELWISEESRLNHFQNQKQDVG